MEELNRKTKEGMVELKDLKAVLARYPLLQQCFEPYMEWLFRNVAQPAEEYDLIALVQDGDLTRLGWLEDHLKRSRELLGMDVREFVRTFGFTTDLLKDDPEKLYDILAEPLLVIDLDSKGFSEIKKFPNDGIKVSGTQIPVADFTAVRAWVRFAIELKTIRTESWAKEGQLLGDATKPAWWREMFLSNARTKIEDKNRRVLTQLENTCKHYGCQVRLLVLYTRRFGPSALMGPDAYREELRKLRGEYPQFDYLACKDRFAHGLVFEPDL